MDELQNKNESGQEKDLPTGTPAQSADNLTTKNQDMETHFHGHMTFKKRWQEYIFQFGMLFLAVFLGFLAENAREHSSEKKTEKDYVRSLMADLVSDNTNALSTAESIYAQIQDIDMLQEMLSSQLSSPNEITQCYQLSIAIQQYYPFSFKEKTISQLLSTGSLRLLKTDNVADSIMDYYDLVKSFGEQKQLYYNYIGKCMDAMYNIYDISLLQTRLTSNKDSLKSIFSYADHFITRDPNEFKKLIALIERAKVTAFLFRNDLVNAANKAAEVHDYLQKTYNIKENEK